MTGNAPKETIPAEIVPDVVTAKYLRHVFSKSNWSNSEDVLVFTSSFVTAA